MPAISSHIPVKTPLETIERLNRGPVVMRWYFGAHGQALPDEIHTVHDVYNVLGTAPTMYEYRQAERALAGLRPDDLLMTEGYGGGDVPHPDTGQTRRAHRTFALEKSHKRQIDTFTYAARLAMARSIPVRIADASREEADFIDAFTVPHEESALEPTDDSDGKRWYLLEAMMREESAYRQFLGRALTLATLSPRGNTPRQISLLWGSLHRQRLQERAEADGLNVAIIQLGVTPHRKRGREILAHICANGLFQSL